MKNILLTRFLHWKKQWLSMTFWLVFPILATLFFIHITENIQDEAKIPVGVVLDEKSDLAKDLYASIKASHLVRIYDLTEKEALHKLGKHELDSVFIIRKGYEENVHKGNRDRILASYQSDLSFAYSPVKEMVISLVQQETGRSKAAYVVEDLSEQYDSPGQWTWEEIVSMSKEVQKEEDLLRTSFSFANYSMEIKEDKLVLFNPWGLWAVFSLLSTLLLFDWLIRERSSGTLSRFAFMKISFPAYLLGSFVIYSILLLCFAILAMGVFHVFLHESINIHFLATVFSYQLMIASGAFILALCFRNAYVYYSFSFAFSLLITIFSGAIIPIEGIVNRYEWIKFVNPLQPFLSGNITYMGLIIPLVIIFSWYIRKEQTYA